MRQLIAAIALIPIADFAMADMRLAVNLHGYSYHFKRHPDIINDRHQMIGAELCENQGYAQLCAGYAHFTDSYGYPNNAYSLHSRYLLHEFVTVGVMGAYVHRYEPRLGAAPELILHFQGVGLRIFCLPTYKERIGFCAINTRTEIP